MTGATTARDFLSSVASSDVSDCLGRVRRHVCRRGLGHGFGGIDVDDIVQDAVLRTLRRGHRASFDNVHAFVAYLRRASERRVVDLARQQARRPPTKAVDETVASSAPTPLASLLARERRRQLRQAMSTLKPALRRALVRQLNGERDLTVLAAVLGAPTRGAARVALSRGRRALARTLATPRPARVRR